MLAARRGVPAPVGAGPMVVSFEPTDEFMYYADGVFVSGEEKIHQEWQKVPAGMAPGDRSHSLTSESHYCSPRVL